MRYYRKVTCGCLVVLLLTVAGLIAAYIFYSLSRDVQPFGFIKKTDQTEVSYDALSPTDKTLADNMQQYLYDQFTPGACFGMPTIEVGSIGGITLPKTNPVNRVYLVSRDNAGHYIFSFSDGSCCTISDYEVEIWQTNDGFEYSTLKKTSKGVPC